MENIILLDAEEKMQKTVDSFVERLNKIKTGRANASLVKDVEIDYWGAMTPLYQVANISIPEASQILIKPYDKSQLKEIEKALILADLGFTPLNDGTVIRCNIPQLTGEVRQGLVKEAYKMSEEAKVAIRNIRRNAITEIKADKTLPEDTGRELEEETQKLTDNFCKKIDDLTKVKEKDLTTI